MDAALLTIETYAGPYDAEIAVEKGRAFLKKGEPDKAKSEFEAVLQSSTSPFAKHSAKKLLGIYHATEGNHDEAQRLFMEVLTVQDEARTRYNLGRSFFAAQKYKDASAVLMPLVDMPGMHDARLLAAASLVKIGDTDKARALLSGYISEEHVAQVLRGR